MKISCNNAFEVQGNSTWKKGPNILILYFPRNTWGLHGQIQYQNHKEILPFPKKAPGHKLTNRDELDPTNTQFHK